MYILVPLSHFTKKSLPSNRVRASGYDLLFSRSLSCIVLLCVDWGNSRHQITPHYPTPPHLSPSQSLLPIVKRPYNISSALQLNFQTFTANIKISSVLSAFQLKFQPSSNLVHHS